MTISTRIRSELFTTTQSSVDFEDIEPASPQLIRLPLTRPPDAPNSSKKKTKNKTKQPTKYKVKVEPKDRQTSHRHGLPWTTDEHDRFLQGLECYPCGPWKAIAGFVGTRTPRQTMTHAQKYRQKIQRRRRGLLTSSRQPVPVTSELYGGLVITTNATDCDTVASTSPTSVDVALKSTDQRMAPLESNWFDKVEVGELDAAFRAFLEVYDPTLFPMDEDIHASTVSTFSFDCNVSMADGASIVL
ncbi:hypothetical protein JG687_00007871 [Phytophthora cactorum]|uniref:HTH myb-type domain-containing protein n=1 Tax=Phytophthora cactorum TaxID=29920 RepID=A0A329SV29_9STRA|nr:hypothetical protein Pcac1_g8238 [Phytophthora cactorum]KAG2814795.1 hypothetical protein PC112_g14164 [Phytophthora cactorum]KAG2816348.1 hypothetical protein PC111_g13178 [Phytophthora cactorum]KAG2853067.1 hypothetical protein PC113_g14481 [Phytophthora cactorum]KAG2895726.1 hypothetical protein PC114_g15405 [Phytophthora cactorum]